MGEPVMLKVPIGDGTEVGLMLALDTVVQHFLLNGYVRRLTDDEAKRAVEWLATRYVRDSRAQGTE